MDLAAVQVAQPRSALGGDKCGGEPVVQGAKLLTAHQSSPGLRLGLHCSANGGGFPDSLQTISVRIGLCLDFSRFCLITNGLDDAVTGTLTIDGGTASGPSSWEQVSAAIDAEAPADFSGSSVSLSADGIIVAIGADGNGDNAGQVRIYQRNASGHWQQVGAAIDGEALGDYFGYSVSLSDNGSTVATDAPGNDGNGDLSGQMRVYALNAPAQQGDSPTGNVVITGTPSQG